MHATVVPGSGQVIQLSIAGEHLKKNAVTDAAARKMDQARSQWRDTREEIEAPGRTHRLDIGFGNRTTLAMPDADRGPTQ